MKKVAIPVVDNKLSQHFGHSDFFKVYLIDDNNKIYDNEFLPPPEHQQGVIPNWIADQQVTDLIVGGIGPAAIDILNSRNVNVFSGANVDSPDNIILDFINGTLVVNANTCDHDSEHHHGDHDGHCNDNH